MLEAENLSYHRNGRHIFSGINFKIEPGTCLLVEGPNGSGKSTLLRVLAGLLPVQTGTLVINGNQAAHNLPAKPLEPVELPEAPATVSRTAPPDPISTHAGGGQDDTS